MKIYEADDYADMKSREIWIFRRDNATIPEQEGEMPEEGSTIQIIYKTQHRVIQVNKCYLMGDPEYSYYPHFIIERIK